MNTMEQQIKNYNIKNIKPLNEDLKNTDKLIHEKIHELNILNYELEIITRNYTSNKITNPKKYRENKTNIDKRYFKSICNKTNRIFNLSEFLHHILSD